MRTQDITNADVRRVMAEIDGELEYELQKYPSPNTNMAALSDEVGELAKAMNKESRARVKDEALQVAVMAIRIILEGDPFIDLHRTHVGLDMTSDAGQVAEVVSRHMAEIDKLTDLE